MSHPTTYLPFKNLKCIAYNIVPNCYMSHHSKNRFMYYVGVKLKTDENMNIHNDFLKFLDLRVSTPNILYLIVTKKVQNQ